MTVLSDGNGLKLKLTPKTLAMIITYVVLVTAGWVTTQNTLSTLAETTDDHLVAGPHPEQLLVNVEAKAERLALWEKIEDLEESMARIEALVK